MLLSVRRASIRVRFQGRSTTNGPIPIMEASTQHRIESAAPIQELLLLSYPVRPDGASTTIGCPTQTTLICSLHLTSDAKHSVPTLSSYRRTIKRCVCVAGLVFLGRALRSRHVARGSASAVCLLCTLPMAQLLTFAVGALTDSHERGFVWRRIH